MTKYGFRILSRICAGVGLAGLCFSLTGCLGNTALDNLDYAKPTGTAFDNALYDNYNFLSRSFGSVGEAKRTVFDYEGSIPLNATDKGIADLANAFAAKAVASARGEFVDPEPARDPASHEVRDHLLRVLDPARTAFARDAARVQADYDCWILNGTVEAQKEASNRCKASLDKIMPRLEANVRALQEKQQAAEKAARQKAGEGQP